MRLWVLVALIIIVGLIFKGIKSWLEKSNLKKWF